MKWKKLSSKQVFEHSRLNVFLDQVELPNGHQTEYLHFGQMPDAAMVIAKNNEGKILLQKEYSYPPDEVLFQFPGGLLDKDENPEQGAKREFAEEAELGGDLKAIGWFYLDNRRKAHKIHVFVATNLVDVNAEADPEEFIESYWFTIREIDKMVRSNKINNHTTLAGWALFKAREN